MMRKFTFFGMAILVVIFSGFAVNRSFAQGGVSDFEEIDAYMSTTMDELGIPGAALVIVQGDQIVHLNGFGVADGDGRPVTPQTPFFTGSTGKSITALAIMQLVEAGQIELDAPVQSYLSWFRVADAEASQIITVRQLLNMTSGIPRAIGQEQLATVDLSDSAIENNVRALVEVELNAPPGQRFEYSNANYVTLGMIIQAVTGQSFESYINESIFQPLDMQNSFTSKTEAQQEGLAVGFQKWFGIPVATPNLPFSRGSLPAGELTMSIEDFGHHLIAQLNGGTYQGVSVLSPSGIAEMHRPPGSTPGVTTSYGMGWEVQAFQNVQVLTHDGAVPGYTTAMFLVPEENLAVALVMNTYSPMLGFRVSRVPGNVLRMLLGQETIQLNEILFRQIIYVLLILIPFLHIFAVVTTLRRARSRRGGARLSPKRQIGRHVAGPLIWNAALAYVLLLSLPKAFEANFPVMILLQPDASWLAVVSGVFAIVWGLISTGIGISMLPQTVKKAELV